MREGLVERVAMSVTGWTDKVDNRSRPSRMKKPKVTPAAHRVYKEYVQDLFHDILVDKYGTERGTKNFEWFIDQNNRAMYTVGQEIQDEKAQMFLDLGERPPSDYWAEGYFDVWQRWMARPASKQAREAGMNRIAVARELVRVAELLTGYWTPVRKDIDIGMRNKEVHDSLSSYAPKIGKEMRKEAALALARQGFNVDSRGELLTKEWSEYLAFIDPEMNANKYHYYVIFSLEAEPGRPVYIGMNCSGRIGIIERSYDLTVKAFRGPANSLNAAKSAVMRHMSMKLRKGYESMPMVRG